MNTTRLLGFFSNFDPARGFPSEVAAFLRAHLTQRDSLVFITSNPAGHAKTDHYAAQQHGWFEAAGLPFTHYHAVDSRTSPAQAAQLVREASCVYLMGGETGLQMQFLRDYGLVQPIRETHAAIMGLSAGAINMAARGVDPDDWPKVHECLGLANISVFPHFDPANQDELSTLQRISARFPIHAMQDESAIFVKNGQTTFIGEITKLGERFG